LANTAGVWGKADSSAGGHEPGAAHHTSVVRHHEKGQPLTLGQSKQL
jgi:hypothetical protein